MSNQDPALPEGQWAINEQEKEQARKLGRELHKFIFEYAKSNATEGVIFHLKIVAAAFQYFMEVQQQKSRMVGDQILALQDAMDRFNFNDFIVEPFEPAPETPAEEVPVDTGSEETPAKDESAPEVINEEKDSIPDGAIV